MKDAVKRPFIIGFFFLGMMAVSGFLLFYAYDAVYSAVRLQTTGESIQGTVESVGYLYHRRRSSIRYTILYDANHDGDLERKKVTAPPFTLFAEFQEGDVVTLIQDPENLDRVEIDRGWRTWIFNYLGGAFLGLLGILSGIGGIFFLKKMKEEWYGTKKSRS